MGARITASAEAAVDVVQGPRVGGVGEHHRRWIPDSTIRPGSFSAARKKAQVCETRWACCMLWVTMTTVTSLAISAMVCSMRRGRGGVERRAGLVHEQHPGPDGQGPGDAQPLLLATRQGAAELAAGGS